MYIQGHDPTAPLKGMTADVGAQIARIKKSAGSIGKTTGDLVSVDKNFPLAEQNEIYRWKDEYGVTHFGSFKPDTPGIEFETVRVDPDNNLIDGYSAAEVGQTSTSEATDAHAIPSGNGLLPMSANPAEIKQMLNNVNELSEARLQQLDNIR